MVRCCTFVVHHISKVLIFFNLFDFAFFVPGVCPDGWMWVVFSGDPYWEESAFVEAKFHFPAFTPGFDTYTGVLGNVECWGESH